MKTGKSGREAKSLRNTHPLSIKGISEQLNRQAAAFDIGRLQRLRADLKKRRASSRTIFSKASTFDHWAFHHGGRTELQFNIGLETLDGAEYLRHGVAFSLETSRSLPSIDVLIPKIRLFNEFVGDNEKLLSQFRMWHFQRGTRFPNHHPTPIAEDLLEPGTFIFLGSLRRRREDDLKVILSDFDLLLPLYKFVESNGSAVPEAPPPFQFRAGHSPKQKTAFANKVEGELSVALREGELQQVLFGELCREYGKNHVGTELPSGSGGRIDVVARTKSGGYAYFEIKAGKSLQGCIRNAIGQLLEYAYWPGSRQPELIVIAGEAALDDKGRSYLEELRKRFSLSLEYRQVIHPDATV
jgi:hypothetical protein